MSELINKNDNRATIRWKLLTGASALALTTYVSSVAVASAEDTSRPLLWIEVGGQLDRLQNKEEPYAPAFVDLTPAPFSPPQRAERPPLFGVGESASLSFQPTDSDWIFSASIQYGRAGSSKHVRHQSYPGVFTAYSRFHRTTGPSVQHVTNYRQVDPVGARFVDAVAKESDNHVILDFQAGKDLGLGLFGSDATSALNLGVRIAQFHSKSRSTLEEDPDWQVSPRISGFNTSYITYFGSPFSFGRTRQNIYHPHHTFAGHFQAKRSFSGLGPSISWRSSMPFAGNRQSGELTVDWGLNAALLFGRQKVKTSHQTSTQYDPGYFQQYRTTVGTPVNISRSRSRRVTVPNVGGFAGISWSYDDAKVIFGYKADFFFGAIDGGIDTRKSENRGFNGPYASISIGIGGGSE